MEIKKIKKIIIFASFFIFLLLSKQVLALGLLSESNKRIAFEPDFKRTYQFIVQHTTKDVEIIIGGYPIEYVTLSRDLIPTNDPDKFFFITIEFPSDAELKPGHHQIKVQANEVVDREHGIGTSVNVATHIKIDVLHPGKYVEANFADASVRNSTAFFTISGNNFGLEKINSFKARIDTYDQEGNKLDTVYTNEKSIESDTRAEIRATLDVGDYEIGDYKAEAFVFWDNQESIVEKVFRVGALRINIVDYTKEFFTGTINKFEIKLGNVWNDAIKDVYATVKINDEFLRSAVGEIDAFSNKIFNVYWDTTNIQPGTYPVEIRAYYLDKTSIEIGQVVVVDKEPTQVKLAKQTKFSMVTIVLVIVILLIIILDIIWLKTRKKD